MSAGADYWKSLDAPWDSFKTNGNIAIGRFRSIRHRWDRYTMTSLSANELKKNPPPVPVP
jgi:hypothetical protein